MAERLAPILSAAEMALAEAKADSPAVSRLSLAERIAIGARYEAATALLPLIRELLYPED